MGSNAVATKVLTTAAYHGPVAGDSKLPSPWRWSLLGTVLALALLIVGLGLGFVVSATYFAVAAGGFVVGLVVLVIALIRAMRPALRRPRNIRRGYHWTTYYMRKMEDPRGSASLPGRQRDDHRD